MIKIALIGYGKMGKMLKQMAPEYDMEIVSIIDPFVKGCFEEINENSLKDCDICVEYTTPASVLYNCKKVAMLGKSVVIGTTGLELHLEELKNITESYNVGIIYSSNYSVGMNLFFKIIEDTAKKFSSVKGYDVSGLEIHHRQKLDSPSGTAKKLTEIILENISDKKVEQYDRVDRKIKEEELHFASIRAGHNMGEHTIMFDSEADVITLSHSIRNRKGLASGTLLATKWIEGKTGLFNFQEVFTEIIGE